MTLSVTYVVLRHHLIDSNSSRPVDPWTTQRQFQIEIVVSNLQHLIHFCIAATIGVATSD